RSSRMGRHRHVNRSVERPADAGQGVCHDSARSCRNAGRDRGADSVPLHAACGLYYGRGLQREWRRGFGGVGEVMNRWVIGVGIATALMRPLAASQTPNDARPSSLNFENGVVSNGAYSNECFGFSLAIPAGWKADDSLVVKGGARHRSDNSLILLYLRKE